MRLWPPAFLRGQIHLAQVCVLHGAVHGTRRAQHCEKWTVPWLQLQCPGARICSQKVVACHNVKAVDCQEPFAPQRYGYPRWRKKIPWTGAAAFPPRRRQSPQCRSPDTWQQGRGLNGKVQKIKKLKLTKIIFELTWTKNQTMASSAWKEVPGYLPIPRPAGHPFNDLPWG